MYSRMVLILLRSPWTDKMYRALTISLYLPMGAHAADDGHTGDEDAGEYQDYPSSLHVGLRLV